MEPVWEIKPRNARANLIHVNATAVGGGVAELLHGLVRRQQAAGTSVGWAVIGGSGPFFEVTKYLHYLLHGKASPDRLSDPAVLRTYREVLATQESWFVEKVGPGDVVVLHDPQTLGLAPALQTAGAYVVWHCHIGTVVAGESGPTAFWNAMEVELSALDAVVTTLPEFSPPIAEAKKKFVIAPAIDPAAPKNRDMNPDEVAQLLAEIGLTAPRTSPNVAIIQESIMPQDARVVIQVSRWDPLKDMAGAVRCIEGLPLDTHLVLAGTDPTEIPDDPEGIDVFSDVLRVLAELPKVHRERVHLVNISMRMPEANATVVNALQRRADVVLQKSLEEGFGLTVTEAMVKARPVVASSVGGLRHQVIDGYNGLLVDPTDQDGVQSALVKLLDDPALRREFGERARSGVLEHFTMQRLVDDYAAIMRALGEAGA